MNPYEKMWFAKVSEKKDLDLGPPGQNPQAEKVRPQDVTQAMKVAVQELNEGLKMAERLFVEKLGDARGRTGLGPAGHLVFRNGAFFVERLVPKRAALVTPLHAAPKEVKAEAAKALPRLWNACGGSPPMKESD